jgi:hypothetical protein
MDGATVPFVAGCIFFGVGALLILSLIQYLVQRTRWCGRAVDTNVSIETLSAAQGKGKVSASADAAETNPAINRHYRPVVADTVEGHLYQVQGAFSDAALDDADQCSRSHCDDADPDRPAAR